MPCAIWGAENAQASAAALYKHAYFIDWRAADTEKHRLHDSVDLYVDTNLPGLPMMIPGDWYRTCLAAAVERPFRVVPFFDPGVWGGEWMRRQFDLPAARLTSPGASIVCPKRTAFALALEIAS